MSTEPAMIPGNQLSAAAQRQALATFVNRFTGQHRPAWANKPMPNGNRYPVQFADDADWLANTRFAVRKDGSLDLRATHCESRPTWPHNPELRTA